MPSFGNLETDLTRQLTKVVDPAELKREAQEARDAYLSENQDKIAKIQATWRYTFF